jgi:hypothetical protein
MEMSAASVRVNIAVKGSGAGSREICGDVGVAARVD